MVSISADLKDATFPGVNGALVIQQKKDRRSGLKPPLGREFGVCDADIADEFSIGQSDRDRYLAPHQPLAGIANPKLRGRWCVQAQALHQVMLVLEIGERLEVLLFSLCFFLPWRAGGNG